MATTADLEALATRVRRRPRRTVPPFPRGPVGLGKQLYCELEDGRGLTWVEVVRELSYRPDAERALSAYLNYRPIPCFDEEVGPQE